MTLVVDTSARLASARPSRLPPAPTARNTPLAGTSSARLIYLDSRVPPFRVSRHRTGSVSTQHYCPCLRVAPRTHIKSLTRAESLLIGLECQYGR